MPVSGGPYLVASFFCDKVLQERDGVLSFIRVVDRWNIMGNTPAMQPTVIQTTLVALFKSGALRSSAQIVVTPITPVSERMPPIPVPVLFEGDDERGAGVVQQIGFPVKDPGLYWFEVAVTVQGGEPSIMTFIPMRIVYLQTGVGTALPPAIPGQHQ